MGRRAAHIHGRGVDEGIKRKKYRSSRSSYSVWEPKHISRGTIQSSNLNGTTVVVPVAAGTTEKAPTVTGTPILNYAPPIRTPQTQPARGAIATPKGDKTTRNPCRGQTLPTSSTKTHGRKAQQRDFLLRNNGSTTSAPQRDPVQEPATTRSSGL